MKITATLKTRQSSLWGSHFYGEVISMHREVSGAETVLWVVCLETGRNNQELGTCRITGLSLYVCGD